MCGIFGVWELDGNVPVAAEVVACRDTMTSRGPDDSGLVIDEHVALAHRRLSIIDLSPDGRMPMSNEAGDVWAVFNGEIYNFVALREALVARGHRFRSRADSEVIVHAYEEWGEASFQRFDGMFAVAVWDRRNQRMILARDAMGEKPLFYRHAAGRQLVFASTLDAVSCYGPDAPSVDADGLRSYLSFGFVPAPNSIWAGVHKVEAGTWLVFEGDGRKRSGRFWDLVSVAAGPRESLGGSDLHETLLHELREAVRSRMIADVPLGAFLSGGIDSSLVVALMAEANPAGVRTFTIGFREEEFDESRHAREIARHLRVENTVMMLSANDVLEQLPDVTRSFDEPMADYSVLPSLAVAAMARQHVSVVLTGDGADEAFGGYRYYSGVYALERAGALRHPRIEQALRRIAPLVPSVRARRAIVRASTGDAAEFFAASGFFRGATSARGRALVLPEADSPTESIAATLRDWHRLGVPSVTEAGMLWDATHTLADAWLCKVDRCSMAFGLEARAPFLSTRVQSLAYRMPLQERVGLLRRKTSLRSVLARYVPRRLFDRPKQGFTAPMADWIRGPLRDEIRDRLARDRLTRFEGVDPEGVARLLEEHMTGRENHAQMLWALLHLDHWMDARALRGRGGLDHHAGGRQDSFREPAQS